MKKKLAALLSAGVVLVSGVGPALAAGEVPTVQEPEYTMSRNVGASQGAAVPLEDLNFSTPGEVQLIQTRATESVTWTIGAGKTSKASTAFPMEAGETVTFNCAYSPRTAAVDFGLIAPDGKFYYLSGSNGNIDQSLRIPERGDYYVAIRNRSTASVEVLGFVNY